LSLALTTCIAQKKISDNEYQRLKAVYETTSYPRIMTRYGKEILAYEKEDSIKGHPTYDIVFIGSSTFEHWKTMKQDFTPANVVNRGFGGSTIREVIYYSDRILYPYNPKVVVLYVGNDVWGASNEPSTETLFDLFKYFEQTLHQKLPNTILNLVSMRPSPAKRKLITRQNAINDLLKNYAPTRKNTNFIDICSVMYSNSGQLRNDIFISDSLHLNNTGNQLIVGVIKPILIKQLENIK